MEKILHKLGRIQGLALAIQMTALEASSISNEAKEIESIASQIAQTLLERMPKP